MTDTMPKLATARCFSWGHVGQGMMHARSLGDPAVLGVQVARGLRLRDIALEAYGVEYELSHFVRGPPPSTSESVSISEASNRERSSSEDRTVWTGISRSPSSGPGHEVISISSAETLMPGAMIELYNSRSP